MNLLTPKFLEDQKFSGLRKYLANTGWLLVDKLLSMSASLIVGIWVARYLGPAQYGTLSYAISFVALFSVLSTLGLNQIVIRELVRFGQKRDQLLGTALGLKLFGAVLQGLILISVVQLIEDNAQTRLIIIIVAVSYFFDAFQVFNFYYQAQTQSKYIAISTTIATLLTNGLRIGLVLGGASLIWFATIVFLTKFIISISLVFFYFRMGLDPFRFHFSFTVAKQLLSTSWPLIFASLAITVYMRVDQVMLKWLLGSEAVGNYAIAVRLSEIWYFIPTVILSSTFPAILNVQKKNQMAYHQRLQTLYTLLLWLAVSIILPISLLSDNIIGFLYGAKYSAASGVLQIYVWGGIAVFTGSVWSKWILAEDKQKLSLIAQISSVILNVPLNLVLIPRYGVNGAAWATLISYNASNFVSFCLYKPLVTFKFLLFAIVPFSQVKDILKYIQNLKRVRL